MSTHVTKEQIEGAIKEFNGIGIAEVIDLSLPFEQLREAFLITCENVPVEREDELAQSAPIAVDVYDDEEREKKAEKAKKEKKEKVEKLKKPEKEKVE